MPGERILVVDDEPEVVRLCTRILSYEGLSVHGTTSGLEALSLLKEEPFDLLLVDIKMPDISGLDLLRQGRQIVPDLSAVVITGFATLDSAIEALHAGAHRFVLKPFSVDELTQAIDQVLLQKQKEQERLSLRAQLPILEIAQVLTVEGDVDYLAGQLLERVAQDLKTDRAALLLLDEKTAQLNPVETIGIRDELVQAIVIPSEDPIAEQVLQGETPFILPQDARGKPPWTILQGSDPQDTMVLAALRTVKKAIGLISLSRQADRSPFTASDLNLLSITSGQIATALENARLYEALQAELEERKRAEEELVRRNEELTALNALAATIGQSFDLDQLLDATLERALQLAQADGGVIYLLEEKEPSILSMVAHRGLARKTQQALRKVKQGESLIGEVALLGQLIVSSDESPAHWSDAPMWKDSGLQVLAGIPLTAQEQVLGVLGIFYQTKHRMSTQEIQIVSLIGRQIGVAIENTRLAQKAAEIEILRELDRLRSELIANVSHELRTPLGLIKIFCTTLLRQDTDFDHEIHQEFLRDIEDETGKLEMIVDNLLDLSRMEHGRLGLEKQPADIGELARRVIESMQVQTTEHQFKHEFPPEPLITMIDSEQIEQVLRNLLSNAVKYSPEGGVITIQGRGEKDELILSVSDQGIGIPPDALEKVFERFYRVDNDVTQRVRGAGLGLSVSRGIIQAHGGSMRVESIQGKGSTFFFSLPKGLIGEEKHA
jgi:K+-sensing histidine kinase KdpD